MAEREKLYTGPFEFHYGGIAPNDLRLEPFDVAALGDAAELVKDLRMTTICKEGIDRCLAIASSGKTYNDLTHAERSIAWLVLAAVNRHVREVNDAVRQNAT